MIEFFQMAEAAIQYSEPPFALSLCGISIKSLKRDKVIIFPL